MAELVDALDSKSSGSDTVWVRFPPEVLNKKPILEIKVGFLRCCAYLPKKRQKGCFEKRPFVLRFLVSQIFQ